MLLYGHIVSGLGMFTESLMHCESVHTITIKIGFASKYHSFDLDPDWFKVKLILLCDVEWFSTGEFHH